MEIGVTGISMGGIWMHTSKQEVIDLITKLPESIGLEDIMYHLFVLDKIKKGQDAIQRGEYIALGDLKKEVESW